MSRALALAVLAVAVGLAARLGAAPTAAPAHGAGPDAPPWLAEFREVWSATGESFYDRGMNGLDWQEVRSRYEPRVAAARDWNEARELINGMLGELRTSHTGYFRPDEFSYWFLASLFFRGAPPGPGGSPSPGDRFRGDFACPTIGVFTVELDGGTFVSGVVEGAPAADAGVLTGDRILTVDGGPWRPVSAFAGKEGRTVVLRVQRSASPPVFLDLAVTPKRVDPSDLLLRGTHLSARVIEDGTCRIAYVRPWYLSRLEPAAVQLRLVREDVRDADALVLDLREGYGGSVEPFLDLFAPGPVLSHGRAGEPPVAANARWRKPAACLVNGRTRSGKELLADAFRRYRYGLVIGERTRGAVLGSRAIPVGEEGLLLVAVSEVLTDGRLLEGAGVEPDVEVPFDLRYAAGRDPQLDRARAALASTLDCAVTP